MKNKYLVFILSCLIASTAWAQQDPAAVTAATENIKDHTKNELRKGSCALTVPHAVQKCIQPTSSGFKQAGALLMTMPSIATAFMSGEDSGKMAEMCQMAALAGLLGSALNGSQDRSCQNASNACAEDCSADREKLKKMREAATDQFAYNKFTDQINDVDKLEAECYKKVEQQSALAKQQAQANQQPMAGAQACQQALNGDEEQEIVDCTQSRFAHYAECSTLGKTDVAGGIGTYEPGIGLDAREGDVDLPDVDDREDYWDALKNKTSGGNQAGRGGGAGAGAGMGGGFGGGPANKAGGAGGKRSGASLVSGGSESSSGGGGWGSGSSDSDFNKKFAGLGDKKKDLKMLTKKVAGQGLGSAEFGASSDDIWTRVYLRTNTRCTKQLVECAANKSQNPYGSFK